MDIDLTPEFKEEVSGHKKEIGRYSCSNLWGMLTINRNTGLPYLPPEKYFEEETKSFEELLKMWRGTGKHKQLENLLIKKGYEVEIKKEFELDGLFTLVGKCDGINEDSIIEIKTSDNLIDKSKGWYDYQVKLYLTIFERPIGYIYQPVTTNTKLYLKELSQVKRDDKFFQKQLLKLIEYHKQLQKLCNK
jgi:hypothetical protein